MGNEGRKCNLSVYYFFYNNFKMIRAKKKQEMHQCDFPGCLEPAEYRAPKDRSLRSYFWFCLKHVQEYNKKWDFLAGLSPDQIEAQLQNDVTWQRPTWKLGTGGSARVVRGKTNDKFHFFDEAQLGMSGYYNPPVFQSRYSRRVQDALVFMDLQPPLSLQKVKQQYKKLAKKYHPDVAKKDGVLFQKLTESYTALVAFIERGES